ncbi:MAG: 7-cyano-7-deazaguanine synthase QueC [Kiritimatiellia bacterium]
MKAVVVLSGGQDSATCLALAVRKYGAAQVAAVTFAYGQRHAIETRYAKRLARRFGIARHKVVRFGFYRDLTTNALLDPQLKITPAAGAAAGSRRPPAPPNTVVEGRNAFFLTAAAVWAKSLGATVLYTGVSQADYSGYPDCRAVFIRAQQRAIRLALDWPIRIVTPFMKMTKAEEWALAAKLGIFELIRDETVTCYNGVPGAGCGQCPSCRLRNRGLREFLKTCDDPALRRRGPARGR